MPVLFQNNLFIRRISCYFMEVMYKSTVVFHQNFLHSGTFFKTPYL